MKLDTLMPHVLPLLKVNQRYEFKVRFLSHSVCHLLPLFFLFFSAAFLAPFFAFVFLERNSESFALLNLIVITNIHKANASEPISTNASENVSRVFNELMGVLQPFRIMLRGFLVSVYCRRPDNTPSQA